MEYELTPQGQYQVKSFDAVKEDCQKFINEVSHDIVIMDDSDKKAVKEARTTIRKKKEELETYRKNFTRSIVGTMETQIMSLEKLLNEEDKKLKQRLDDYEAMKKNEEEEVEVEAAPATFQIIVTSLNQEDIEKVSAYAKKLKCKVQVK